MVERPEGPQAFLRSDARAISVHAESSYHLHRLVQRIQAAGRLSIALNPATLAGR